MPTVLTVHAYRLCFYSNEGNEPPHIHIQKAEKHVKFWPQPIQLAESIDFTSTELQQIQDIVIEHLELLLGAGHEHFTQ